MEDPSGYFDGNGDLKTYCSLLNQEASGLDLVDKRQACSVSHPPLYTLSLVNHLSLVNPLSLVSLMGNISFITITFYFLLCFVSHYIKFMCWYFSTLEQNLLLLVQTQYNGA